MTRTPRSVPLFCTCLEIKPKKSPYFPDTALACPRVPFRPRLDLNARQQAIAARQAAVRTLGNLTLLNLSVNRQVQNHAFLEKRDLLIANTNLRLNIPLITRPTWDEAGIAERGKLLTETAVKLWPGPRP
jgi:Protein of unknown function (DUF1524)